MKKATKKAAKGTVGWMLAKGGRLGSDCWWFSTRKEAAETQMEMVYPSEWAVVKVRITPVPTKRRAAR